MDFVIATTELAAINVIPGPTGDAGDGTHEVDLSAYYAPGYAIAGIAGMFAITVVAFIVAMRRRLRRLRRR